MLVYTAGMDTSRPPSETPPPAPNLGWSLAALLRAYQARVEAALADLPGGARAFLVMSFVDREAFHSQAAIAERLALDKTGLTYLLDGLEKAALVRRATDPGDRRNRHISLTAKGRQALATAAATVDAVEQHLLTRLSAEEAQLFRHLLVKATGLALPGDTASDAAEAHEICLSALNPGKGC